MCASGQASPQVRLSGKTKRLHSAGERESDLAGARGEVERDQAITVIKRLHHALLLERVGALDRNDDWWDVKWHDPEPGRRGATAYRFARNSDRRGRPDGYVAFRVKNNWEEAGAEVIIDELSRWKRRCTGRAVAVRS